ncbi:MAG: type IX secretion system outer membrane channel protein PorV [Candidatus Pedobacter colombiensis]|uniref:Type IX secretion system outer membrane channel protein PorV n=1 Tax=Candidatus Pedobacter colombiensis TaxID=3121371 RepID=A0AAJ6B6E4_9SPHI|nr:type IX secretion system outer membrane channel protein PorV [Pedobacter sp.]WEK18361.1 MAG: type IX secretion system outer membrane channel protein PorV [Pedobacter sp.]
MKCRVFLFFYFAFCITVSGQININGSSSNAITTAVPFLTVIPDARSGALGDAGVAISADANAVYANPAKLAFSELNTAFSLSYSPWLRNFGKDMNLAYASFTHKINDRNAFGVALNYFNMGSVDLFDANANALGKYTPSDFSFETAFSRRLGEKFALGISLKYIHSGLAPSFVDGQQLQSVNAIATGVSLYHTSKVTQFGKDAIFSFGANLSNIGTKISYSETGKTSFMPTNLKVGAANSWLLDDKSMLTLTLDLNKLLVPTPPLRDVDGTIISGKDDDVSMVSGMFRSFNDAPGGFKEELKEISYSTGLEFWYDKQFALRAGYFYESPDKGNRQYATLGAGFKYSMVEFNFAYIAANQNKSPLANTLRFSLLFNLDVSKN